MCIWEHLLLANSDIAHEIVAAIDVNTTANKIYKHNFPETNLMDCGIESLTARQLDGMKIDMIVMSPPCQPFTRVGKKLDAEDIRTQSFLHLLSLLPRLNNCPKYILVENVKGFEESETCLKLHKTLMECNFAYQEFLLTPLQFGIPNSRLRYYLIAKKAPLKFCFENSSEILNSLPVDSALRYVPATFSSHQPTTLLKNCNKSHRSVPDVLGQDHKTENTSQTVEKSTDCTQNTYSEQDGTMGKNYDRERKNNDTRDDSQGRFTMTCTICRERCLQTSGDIMRQLSEDCDKCQCRPVMDFLEDNTPQYFDSFMLTKKDLKRFIVMDIVFPCLQKTTCFTKRYGHFMEGAGSIFQMSEKISDMEEASELKIRTLELKNRDNWSDEDYQVLLRLKLRYFTPREIANFLCFPSTYHFPKDLSRIQLYRTLGNSLNVYLVSILLQLMVKDPK
ncbi:tRNA (cytosine(38)-C(5))-methyltransferase-like isoform X2 [Ostrea edulis]|uniref:tRNA (cytosine(38)-C(5))-methyltransferase-like isoform X2 n=1 Tax=Ostrea edulis TaxID=37623 RepID=UPI002095D6D6|nr:tRNA (cytosine(38)-C(5))-methyltransferase-like isoform X2 [Ostrea edulis]